ncbi:MAG: crossover junction endodeoxyribonuclease RuvC [Alphaproteobacteria bacterium]|nr:crossover junction endodeoxyribonuclease RuvC [Alphaproteobacteria bacterium]MBQ3946101.1 crossover junction endodeoxyribonuclease RuvC [Alphaproteobacteria bacterium]
MSNRKIILGIDPGLVKTGWGVVYRDGSEVGYINCGVIRTKAENAMETRLCHIFDKISALVNEYKPDAVAMEEVFINKNFASSEKLIMARTSAFLAIAKHGYNIDQYKPNAIKKNITGSGHASKEQIYTFVRKILKIEVINDTKIHTFDSFDALAIALSRAFRY